MSLTLGTTLKTAEKHFGPALAGRGDESHTMSAIRFAAGKGKKFAGVPGLSPDAVFYIHFPLPIDFTKIKSKSGQIDHVKDLTEDGPQSRQGRQDEVDAFLRAYAQKTSAAQEKVKKAAEKFRVATEKKEKLAQEKVIAEYLLKYQTVTFSVDGHSITAKITTSSAKGKTKIKLSAEFILE